MQTYIKIQALIIFLLMSIREAESEPLFGNVRLILDSIFAISLGLASPVITGGFTKQVNLTQSNFFSRRYG